MKNKDTKKNLFHTLSAEEVLDKLETRIGGLTSHEASQRLHRFGKNSFTEKNKKTIAQLILKQFADFMVIVLIVAAVVSGLIGDITDTVVIGIIIFINALIGFLQEFKAEKALDELKNLTTTFTTVIRDGKAKQISSIDLVPGDIVILEAGNIIPADIRLIETFSLKTNESSLTGESHNIEKSANYRAKDNSPIGDHFNMAYKGTFATHGRAKGVVTATGMNTEFGKIAGLLQGEETQTPLQKRLTDFGKKLSIVVIFICVVVFGLGILRGEEAIQMLLTSISLAVAAIPEALPAVITIALALGARKMIKINSLIRNLPAVETLGSVTYICSDKTGTLTQNKMRVMEVFINKQLFKAENFHTVSLIEKNLLLEIIALNNDVQLGESNTLIGESTEIALMEFANQNNFIKTETEIKYPRIAEVPFDSTRKRMTTIHEKEDCYFIYTKGALESILECSNLKGEEKKFWINEANNLAQNGLRVLGFAYKKLEKLPEKIEAETIETNLTIVGFIGLMDPPRPEAKQAIEKCKQAGIKPVMITGDHILTATCIAKELGIISHETDRVISGSELSEIKREDFLNEVEHIKVYARVSPEQKLRIVEALQEKNQFVGMTGDGINDAPALKKADVGIAMGITGTDVSKEAADMVLTDDNFATIIKSIEEGRRIFDNIRKFIRYTMTSNAGEIWTILLAPFLNLPVALLPIHILWINLVTDGLPGLALASEKADKDIMKRPPRHPKESVFAGGLGLHIIWVGFLIGAISVAAEAIAVKNQNSAWQTIVFTVLCFSQMGHVFAVRSEKELIYQKGLFSNKQLTLAVALTFFSQLVVIYVPYFNRIFKTQPLSLIEMLFCISLSLIVFHAVELEKWIYKRLQTK